jgi:redox-sensitive bicupin YhaK (pirin superfamily)
MSQAFPEDSVLQTVVVPRTRDLGDKFEVRRALPSVERRMVGPFVFFDQMGPTVFAPGRGLDVRPHPHIGLATVTYLMQGEILHRDSLGTEQAIRPGEVNWMTAGRGIVHSERTASDLRSHENALAGLQCWVALPARHEEVEPAFSHHSAQSLPVVEGEGARAILIAGSFFGKRAPVPTLSDLFYVDLQLQPGARIDLPAEYAEQALYVVEGKLSLGRDGEFEAGQLLVLKPNTVVTLQAVGGAARVMLLGGEPMEGPRFLTWNFVSSSAERIEQAKDDWQQQRFPKVPGDEHEFIPLPDLPGRPVSYP